MRTQAIQATYDISDRMRANPEGVDNQEYPITVAEAPADTTATGQALTDLTEWRALVEQLPGGRSQIVRSVVGTVVVHTITVFWDEERRGVAVNPGDGTGLGCGPDPAIDLRCMTLTL
jgi:Tfp pilus assembly protein PilV